MSRNVQNNQQFQQLVNALSNIVGGNNYRIYQTPAILGGRPWHPYNFNIQGQNGSIFGAYHPHSLFHGSFQQGNSFRSVTAQWNAQSQSWSITIG